MFGMFQIWAILVLAAPFASALDIVSIIGNFVTGGSITMTWTTTASDPTSFSVELFHSTFEDTYAIATNVNTSLLSNTMTIPVVPDSDGFYIQLVNIFDVNTVYSTSKSFAIGAENATASLTVKESAVPTTATKSSASAGSSSSSAVSISTKPAPSTTSNTGAATDSAPVSSSTAPSSSAPSATGTSAALAVRAVFGGSFSAALLVALGVVVGALAI